MYDKEMACRIRPRIMERIIPQSQIFSYGRSIFVCHIWPKHFIQTYLIYAYIGCQQSMRRSMIKKTAMVEKKAKTYGQIKTVFWHSFTKPLAIDLGKIVQVSELNKSFLKFSNCFYLAYLPTCSILGRPLYRYPTKTN